jgi:hypothetical protein
MGLFVSRSEGAPCAHDGGIRRRAVVWLTFKYDGGDRQGRPGTLLVDGNQVAQGQIARMVPIRFSLDKTFDVGEDTPARRLSRTTWTRCRPLLRDAQEVRRRFGTAKTERGRATAAAPRGCTGGRGDSIRVSLSYAGLKREYWRNLAISGKPPSFATTCATSKSTIRSAPAKSRARCGSQSTDAAPVS